MAKGTALTVVDIPALPAELEEFFEQEANIIPRAQVPTLSPGGKKWTINLEGDSTVLMRKNADGDEEPVQVFSVIVLAHNKNRGRSYYSSGFDPAKPARPDCWSDDAVRPSEQVKDPPSKTRKCNDCPMSVKGSKVQDNGKEGTACSLHKMLVVVPANRIDFEPLRLKIAITSDYAPDTEGNGWYAFSGYLKFLLARMGSKKAHTVRVVTKMKFDPGVNYPKILFSASRPTTDDELIQIVEVLKTKKDKIEGLLTGNYEPQADAPAEPEHAASSADDGEDEDDAPAPAPAPKPAPKPAPAAASVAPKPEPAKPAPAPKPAPKPAGKTAAQLAAEKARLEYERTLAAAQQEEQAAPEGEDEGEVEMPAPKPVPAPKPAAAKANGAAKPAPAPKPKPAPAPEPEPEDDAVAETPASDAELEGLLESWGD